jgi:hypothetical protein
MWQMQDFAFSKVIVWCRGLAVILAMLTSMAPAVAQTQSLDVDNAGKRGDRQIGSFHGS